MAIGAQGAKNGGLLAAQIIALSDPKLNESLSKWRIALSSSIPNEPKDE
jgi:5-(carboxyamino)imidazole ribonucleotide mutase